MHPQASRGRRHLRRPALLPRPRRLHDRDMQLRQPPRDPARSRRGRRAVQEGGEPRAAAAATAAAAAAAREGAAVP